MLLLLAVVAGCGSGATDDLPPAAEPRVSPPLAERPAGATVRVGPAPEGVVADAETGIVAAALRTPDRIALVSGSGRGRPRLVDRIPVSESARHLQLKRPGGPVLVPAERANRLDRVALPGGAVTSTRVGRYPHDATPAGGAVWVANELGDTLSVVRPAGTRTVPTARQPGGIAALDGGRRVAVVAVRQRTLELWDAERVERLARVPAGVGPTHVVTDGRGLAYVVDTRGDGLLVFDMKPRLRLTRRVSLPGAPYGVAVDRRRGRLWVTLTETNRVVELAAGPRPRLLRELPTVRQPDAVAVDAKTGRVWITGRTAGVLQWFDPRG